MLSVEVNIVALILATLLSVGIGFVWYAKQMFGGAWQKFVGLSDKQIQEGASTPMLIAPVLALFQAFVLTHALHYVQAFYPEWQLASIAILTSFWAWIGFTLPAVGMAYLFAQRRKKLLLIDACYQLVSLVGMGLVIAAFL